MLLDKASRFIWELSCDEKQETLFMQAMTCLVDVIEKTDELSLLTDGERRYSKVLFQICYDTLQTGKRGRPRKVLKQGMKVRLKNSLLFKICGYMAALVTLQVDDIALFLCNYTHENHMLFS